MGDFFRDISPDAFHDRFAVGREALSEHIVDRYPVEIDKTRVQGVRDNPMRFEELHECLQLQERRVSPQRAELNIDSEKRRHRIRSGKSNQGRNLLSILEFFSRRVEVPAPVLRSHGGRVDVHDGLP